jgi:type IV pilus assembly protein PilA
MHRLVLRADHFSSKDDQGFTLVELLVVIIIISVLAAISLPSYLNQAGKARGTEAKSNLSLINKSQQAFRLENKTMAPNISSLEVKISGKFYRYSVGASDADNATATALLNPSISTDIKNYSAAITQVPSAGTQSEFFGSIICETLQNNTAPTAGTPPASPNTQGTCPASMTQID